MSDWAQYFNDGMNDAEVASALAIVPPNITHFLKTKIQPIINSQNKIQAIRTLREESDLGLRTSKCIVDAMSSGAKLGLARYGDPRLIDAIEYAEKACKDAIRAAGDDNKSAAALLGVREQLADLWTELVELPQLDLPHK